MCDYIMERTGHVPDIREVALLDTEYITELMNFGTVKAYARTQRKKKHA